MASGRTRGNRCRSQPDFRERGQQQAIDPDRESRQPGKRAPLREPPRQNMPPSITGANCATAAKLMRPITHKRRLRPQGGSRDSPAAGCRNRPPPDRRGRRLRSVSAPCAQPCAAAAAASRGRCRPWSTTRSIRRSPSPWRRRQTADEPARQRVEITGQGQGVSTKCPVDALSPK